MFFSFVCFCVFLVSSDKLQIINAFLIMILSAGEIKTSKFKSHMLAFSYFSLWVVTEMVRYPKEVRRDSPKENKLRCTMTLC